MRQDEKNREGWDLFDGFRAGDEAKGALFVGRYSRFLFRLAFRFLGDIHWAEEKVQEAFTRVLERGAQRRTARVEAYLGRVVVNCSISNLRRRKRQPDRISLEKLLMTAGKHSGEKGCADNLGATQHPGPLEASVSREQAQILHECLRSLPVREQRVLVMYFYGGLRLREIAEALGLTEARISQLKAQAFEALRLCLEEHGLSGEV